MTAAAGIALVYGAGIATGWTLARRVSGYMLGLRLDRTMRRQGS